MSSYLNYFNTSIKISIKERKKNAYWYTLCASISSTNHFILSCSWSTKLKTTSFSHKDWNSRYNYTEYRLKIKAKWIVYATDFFLSLFFFKSFHSKMQPNKNTIKVVERKIWNSEMCLNDSFGGFIFHVILSQNNLNRILTKIKWTSYRNIYYNRIEFWQRTLSVCRECYENVSQRK